MKLMYGEIFRSVIDKINGPTATDSQRYIAILDIAGFGKLI